MMYVRGNPVDYNNWNIPGWSYPELLPFFKKTEKNLDPNADGNYHGFDGPLHVGEFNYVPDIVRDVCSAAQELGKLFHSILNKSLHSILCLPRLFTLIICAISYRLSNRRFERSFSIWFYNCSMYNNGWFS